VVCLSQYIMQHRQNGLRLVPTPLLISISERWRAAYHRPRVSLLPPSLRPCWQAKCQLLHVSQMHPKLVCRICSYRLHQNQSCLWPLRGQCLPRLRKYHAQRRRWVESRCPYIPSMGVQGPGLRNMVCLLGTPSCLRPPCREQLS